MVYLMQSKAGGQFSPLIDMERYYYEGPLANLEKWELEAEANWPHFRLPAIPSMHQCERIPDEMLWRVPKQVHHSGPRFLTRLPDYLGIIVSKKMATIVENHDPGIHQFIPVDIIHKASGKNYTEQEQFYFFNRLAKVCPQDLFDYDYMKAQGLLVVHESKNKRFRKYFVGPTRYSVTKKKFVYDGYKVFPEAFRGRSIINCLPCGDDPESGDVHGTIFGPLVTEDFKADVLSRGINCVHFHPIAV